MQSKTVNIIRVVGAILVILMASAVLAASKNTATPGDGVSHGMHGPQAIVLTLSGGTVSGMNASFSVDSIARIGKTNAAVTSFDKPLQGTMNMSNGLGYISTANMLPSTTRRDYVNNSSIPVAGTSIVLGLEGIKVTDHWNNTSDHWKGNKSDHWKGNMTGKAGETGRFGGNKSCHCRGHSLEFSKLVVGFSNGTVKTYTLDKPVKVIFSKRTKMAIIDADPSFAKLIAGLFKSAQAYPSNAPSLPLKSLITAT